MSEEWHIICYKEVDVTQKTDENQETDQTQPIQELLKDLSLTPGELKQLQVRLFLLKNKGLSLLVERSDILDKIETEKNLYELRLDNTPNNPRFFLCALTGKRLVILHAFKKKGRKTPQNEINLAAKRRDLILAQEAKKEKGNYDK
ncbi:type II toxin-antitoxin system RelE/ParE family toxin [Anabaena azotica]|uniref:type II toxin-antitoxin system RelE/ParE family toxin n=1 Tax=Anabaena azotica TaxID=197653 RepID=UPI0039A418F0